MPQFFRTSASSRRSWENSARTLASSARTLTSTDSSSSRLSFSRDSSTDPVGLSCISVFQTTSVTSSTSFTD